MMKEIKLLLLLLVAFSASNVFGQIKVGDNASTIDPRSLLELESKTKALFLPRLTDAEISAQTGWKAGMLVYNTTDSCLQYYNGIVWDCLTDNSKLGLTDTDSTNELNKDFFIENDSLKIEDSGGELAIALNDIIDTTSLSNRINDKLSISDTSMMLAPYLRLSDTSLMLSPYLRTADTIRFNVGGLHQ
jgi:hypothetical protein